MTLVHLAVTGGILAALLLWMPNLVAVHRWGAEGALITAAILGTGSLVGTAGLAATLIAVHALVTVLRWCGVDLPEPDPPFRGNVLYL